MVQGNVNDWLSRTLGEGDVDMLEVSDELSTGTGDSDDTGLDVEGDALRDRQGLARVNVLHFVGMGCRMMVSRIVEMGWS